MPSTGKTAGASTGSDSRAGRFLSRVRYRGATYVVACLLTIVGVANIYPFLWMLGTSFKSVPEASTERALPVPLMKYWLAKTIEADAPALKTLGERQSELLVGFQEEDDQQRKITGTFVETRITAEEYAEKYRMKPEEARAELNALVDKGWLVQGRTIPKNYQIVWKDMRFYIHFLTTLVLSAAVVFFAVLMTSMAGYALARLRFPGRMLFLGLLLVGAVAPRDATFLPVFRMLYALDLLDGLWGMVLWLSSLGLRYTLLMAAFFLTIPKEVEEAAAIDGAGAFRIFFDVAFPMARPIVMAVAFFSFLGAWNQFLIPFVCTLSRPTMQPLAVAIFNFQRGHQGLWPHINAASGIMIVPVIILFLIFQKQIVKSIAAGAVKG